MFNLNLSMEPVKNVFVYKCLFSLALLYDLYLAELFILTEWFQIQKEFTTVFEEMSLEERNKNYYAFKSCICRQENVTAVWSF